MLRAGMCRTTNTAAGRSGGRAAKMPLSGAVAPLEPPMTMMSRFSMGAPKRAKPLAKERRGDGLRRDRLFAVLDRGMASGNDELVIARREHEGHATLGELVGHRIDHLAMQVYVEDGAI